MAPSDEDLLELISSEALIDRGLLTRHATLSEIGLDSVGVVSVIFAIEEKYGVEVSDEAFTDTADFGQFLDIIKTVIAKKH